LKEQEGTAAYVVVVVVPFTTARAAPAVPEAHEVHLWSIRKVGRQCDAGLRTAVQCPLGIAPYKSGVCRWCCICFALVDGGRPPAMFSRCATLFVKGSAAGSAAPR
jgi:hypothetical protein